MRTDKYILDDDGNPVPCDDVLVWAEWYEQSRSNNCRVVKQDWAETEDTTVGVSTVFLALDHAFMGGPPILWESLVFGTSLDGEMRRYRSKAEALRGHEELVQRVRAVYHEERSERR
jgi:hypothetical protein